MLCVNEYEYVMVIIPNLIRITIFHGHFVAFLSIFQQPRNVQLHTKKSIGEFGGGSGFFVGIFARHSVLFSGFRIFYSPQQNLFSA